MRYKVLTYFVRQALSASNKSKIDFSENWQKPYQAFLPINRFFDHSSIAANLFSPSILHCIVPFYRFALSNYEKAISR
ncbi:MAG: hypothetical protein NWQ46_06180, partial [Spirosomaceae bacterium]|nr:hypothetical protein [Spirosomataceae bacterium]